jgi:hypothetical protein
VSVRDLDFCAVACLGRAGLRGRAVRGPISGYYLMLWRINPVPRYIGVNKVRSPSRQRFGRDSFETRSWHRTAARRSLHCETESACGNRTARRPGLRLRVVMQIAAA